MIGAITAGLYGTGAAPAVPGNFYSLQTVTSSGGLAAVTFSSIPSTYKHLQIRAISSNSYGATNSLNVNLNSDSTTTNYYWHRVSGNGSSASANNANQYRIIDNAGATPYFAASVIDILDYANTSKNTTIRTLTGYDANGSGIVGLSSTLWNNTAAVNSISISATGTFDQYTTFALYGVL